MKQMRIFSPLMIAFCLMVILHCFFNLPKIEITAAQHAQQVYLAQTFISVTYTQYLPVIYRPPIGLYGYVTDHGLPAPNIVLTLTHTYLRPPFTAIVMTTTTQGNGLYHFKGVQSISSCDDSPYCQSEYRVSFESDDPDQLGRWSSNGLRNYTAGSAVNISNFDVSASTLFAPANGAVLTSTIGFSWQPRQAQDDDYSVLVYDPMGVYYETRPLGWVGGYVLDINKEVCPAFPNDPCSNWYGRPLHWALRIQNDTGYAYLYAQGVFTATNH